MLRGLGYNTKADMFSLGALLYSLISGKFLFSTDDMSAASILKLNKICNLSHVPLFTKHVSEECRDLLLNLLEPNPELRISCKKALKHDWFAKDKHILL